MAGEHRVELAADISPARHICIGSRGHIIRQHLHRRALRLIARHYPAVRREAGYLPRAAPHVQVVGMALAVDILVGCEYHVGLEFPHGTRDAAKQLVNVIARAVAQADEAHIRYAEHLRRRNCLAFALFCELVAAERGRPVAVAPVGAYQERDVLALGGKLRRRRPRADLDIVRMRADEEIPPIRLQLHRGHGEFQGKAGQAHCCASRT